MSDIKHENGKHVWVVCPDCGEGRWMQKANVQKSSGRCKKCYLKSAKGDMRQVG